MSEREQVLLELGFVLHQRPYRNTSQLLECMTAVHGRVRLLDGLAEGLADDQLVHGRRVGAVHAGHRQRQPGEDLRLDHPAGLQRDGGAGVADLVAHGQGSGANLATQFSNNTTNLATCHGRSSSVLSTTS